jgi:hypothetical protein
VSVVPLDDIALLQFCFASLPPMSMSIYLRPSEYLCAKATLEVVMEGGSGRYFSCAKPVYTPLAAHYEWHQ